MIVREDRLNRRQLEDLPVLALQDIKVGKVPLQYRCCNYFTHPTDYTKAEWQQLWEKQQQLEVEAEAKRELQREAWDAEVAAKAEAAAKAKAQAEAKATRSEQQHHAAELQRITTILSGMASPPNRLAGAKHIGRKSKSVRTLPRLGPGGSKADQQDRYDRRDRMESVMIDHFVAEHTRLFGVLGSRAEGKHFLKTHYIRLGYRYI